MRTGTVRVRVRFGETDAAGIVYFGTYFGWFDVGTANLARVPGVAGTQPDGKPTYPLPLVECGANFFAPLRYDQEIDIVSTVANVGETSVRVEHEIRALDGAVVARGFEQRVYVIITGATFAKAPIPPDLRTHLMS